MNGWSHHILNPNVTGAGNKAVSEVKRLYFKLRREVFSEPDFARRSQALDGFLQAHLGTQMKMGDIQHPRSMVHSLVSHLKMMHPGI